MVIKNRVIGNGIFMEKETFYWNRYCDIKIIIRNWIFCKLNLKGSWIGINGNWIRNLIKNVVNWDGNVLILIELKN